MRLTIVADNSTEVNWGCRATSIALRQLLSRDHEIVGTITRDLLKAPLTSSRRATEDLHWGLTRRLRRPKLLRAPVAGRIATAVMDAGGRYHAPTDDAVRDGELLWTLRETSPKARRIVAAIAGCDAIVVNGEGEMIFSTPPRPTLRQTLAICALAGRMGKRVFYVNGMISRPPDGRVDAATVAAAAGVLAGAQVAVRDHHSVDVAAELLPGIAPPFFADSLFTWRRHFAETATARYDASRVSSWFERTGTAMPAVCNTSFVAISGSSSAAPRPVEAAARYTELVGALKALGLPMLLMPTCLGDNFLHRVARRTGVPIMPADAPIMACAAVAANAQLLVSGRWHPSIMAALGGTPCVFLGSNSHKTLSIQHLLRYDDPVEYGALPSAEDIAQVVLRARGLLKGGMGARARVSEAAAAMEASAGGLQGFVR
ncbi:polysaccharide pyruvyl transferase family protein [Sphingomonas prati]|uniref:Polysaccharide pyruvyl transferase domain-containing protein n=1 Tax=Sphingomonas prati TaxID=1843237 RepID=A0A7W9BSA4_9SPHN|nr:polysaccharide pyruvyl transferase family protein [Sphingomonas prati]MBB5729224.1 hypothetical protein [Sphingomonas prati]